MTESRGHPVTETATTGTGHGVPGVVLWLWPPPPGAPVELQAALIDWARENRLDPGRIVGSEGVEVDLVDRAIRYVQHVDPHAPGAVPAGGFPAGPNSMWIRRSTAPLLVEPPALLRRPPVGHMRIVGTVPGSPTDPADRLVESVLIEADALVAWALARTPAERRDLADYLSVGIDASDPRAPLVRRLRDALEENL